MTAVASSDNSPNLRSTTRTERGQGWWGLLPDIRLGDHRCWLPLSDRAMNGLGLAMSEVDGDGNLLGVARRNLARTLLSDPPLFLYALLELKETHIASELELAESACTSLLTRCAGGDWILAAPEIQPSDQLKWSRLMARTLTREPSDWSESLTEWLHVKTPTLPGSAIPSLPRVLLDKASRNSRDANAGARLLQRIARGKRRELETEDAIERLATKRKMAAAKELAYGLSHEINNPLANISARAQALEHEETDPKRQDSLRQIVAQVYRAHEMIAGLMFFANPPEPSKRAVDLHSLVHSAKEEFTDVAEESHIRLLTETSSEAAWVRGDRAMLFEAVRVLVRNSIEAIGEGGTIVISTEQVGSEGSHEAIHDQDSTTWMLHVADSGPGLSAKESLHAFDPFFCGREAGRGLGLGLCRAYRVAQLHDATIRLSGGLAGCVATIELPAVSAP
ncbi:MAG: ATP-binding protein [Planctomycetota bacterium]